MGWIFIIALLFLATGGNSLENSILFNSQSGLSPFSRLSNSYPNLQYISPALQQQTSLGTRFSYPTFSGTPYQAPYTSALSTQLGGSSMINLNALAGSTVSPASVASVTPMTIPSSSITSLSTSPLSSLLLQPPTAMTSMQLPPVSTLSTGTSGYLANSAARTLTSPTINLAPLLQTGAVPFTQISSGSTQFTPIQTQPITTSLQTGAVPLTQISRRSLQLTPIQTQPISTSLQTGVVPLTQISRGSTQLTQIQTQPMTTSLQLPSTLIQQPTQLIPFQAISAGTQLPLASNARFSMATAPAALPQVSSQLTQPAAVGAISYGTQGYLANLPPPGAPTIGGTLPPPGAQFSGATLPPPGPPMIEPPPFGPPPFGPQVPSGSFIGQGSAQFTQGPPFEPNFPPPPGNLAGPPTNFLQPPPGGVQSGFQPGSMQFGQPAPFMPQGFPPPMPGQFGPSF